MKFIYHEAHQKLFIRRRIMKSRIISTPLGFFAISLMLSLSIYAAGLALPSQPLFVTSSEKANILVILDNSNSMDEDSSGAAIGGANANSKSEIARGAIKGLISTYTGKINMGLMAYQQPEVTLMHIHNAPYDVSFDPANYNPAFTGSRDSLTKRFRTPNTSSPGEYLYYNIALPFYSGSDKGSRFCYSDTADFDNGSESHPGGPWDDYRCFRNKTTTTDALPIFNNTASEAAAGFTSHAFDSRFIPTDSDLAQNLLDFGRYITWNRVSLTWFADKSPGRGYIHIPIATLDTTQASSLNTKLGTSQFVTNGPTDTSRPLQNAGLTPIEGTLLTAKDYFSGAVIPINEGGGSLAALPESCHKNFIALLTDGLPSANATGTVTKDPTIALAAAATAASSLKTANVETYVIGFSLPVGTDPTSLDAIAAAGGTNTAYSAGDPISLKASFDTIFSDILAKTAISSAPATNSGSISANSVIYQAKFNSGDWSGELLALPISTSGEISATEDWSAANKLSQKTATSRVILTYGRDTNDGIPFRWADISTQTDTSATKALNTEPITSTTDSLGSDRVEFIRGGTGGPSANLFRSDRNGKLGDIVHSSAFYVGKSNAGYSESSMPGYSAHRNSVNSRPPITYTGANDGMLHGFNAASGEEVLAYIPKEITTKLNILTAKGYGSTLPHEYFVDGSPMVADAKVGSNWKTVLAGGLNLGGQGVYALDISNPTNFSESITDSQKTVLWEFTDEDDSDLGYTFLDPTISTLTKQSVQIAKMANGKWAVILGNGYNNTEIDGHVSTTGHAYLYILFIEEGTDGTWTSGTDYIKIDTGKGSITTPNGLATPKPIDDDGDNDVDYIYAGDLLGNLWKFDVSSSSTSNWGIALSDKKPLFTAKDSSNTIQPITSVPVVTPQPNGGYIVGFGTGKYLEHSDIASTNTQTIYGIWDNDSNISSRSSLVEQTVLATHTTLESDYRITSANNVDYTSKKGWYMDLAETGERVDVNPIIRDGRFIFITRTPSTLPCVAGGTSWEMDLNYLSGGRLKSTPYDINNDGVLNALDLVTITETINGLLVTKNVSISGRKDRFGGMKTSPLSISTGDPNTEIRVSFDSDDSDDGESIVSADPSYRGRMSWHTLQ